MFGNAPNRLLVERLDHRAIRRSPLGDTEAPVTRHKGRGLFETQIVERGPRLTPDLQDVAEALGRDQRGRGDVSLDDRIGRNRRAMHHIGHLRRVDIVLAQDAAHRIDEPNGRICRGGGHFGDMQLARLFTDQCGVGEGSPGIDPQSISLTHSASSRSRSVARVSTVHVAGSIATL